AVDGDPQVAFHLGVQLAADGLVDTRDDPVGLAVVIDVLDAPQDRVGGADADVGGPRTVRVLLVVAQVSQHTFAHLVEQARLRVGRGVGGLEESLALGTDDSGEERPLVGEVVIHQRPRHPGALGDLVDAHLVVRTLAEDFGAQCQQLVAAIVGGQPSPGFRHAASIVDTCLTAARAGRMTSAYADAGPRPSASSRQVRIATPTTTQTSAAWKIGPQPIATKSTTAPRNGPGASTPTAIAFVTTSTTNAATAVAQTSVRRGRLCCTRIFTTAS